MHLFKRETCKLVYTNNCVIAFALHVSARSCKSDISIQKDFGHVLGIGFLTDSIHPYTHKSWALNV